MEVKDEKTALLARGSFEVVRPIAETHRAVAEFLGVSTSALTAKYLESGPELLEGLTFEDMCIDLPRPAERIFGVLKSRPGKKDKMTVEWQIRAETYQRYKEWSNKVGAAAYHGAMYSAFIAGLMDDVHKNHLVLDASEAYIEDDFWMDRILAGDYMGGGFSHLDRDPNW